MQTLERSLDARFTTLEQRLTRADAMISNGLASQDFDLIVPVPRSSDRRVPRGLPATVLDFRKVSATELSRLLTFYGLPRTGDSRDKLRRLAKALGIRTEH